MSKLYIEKYAHLDTNSDDWKNSLPRNIKVRSPRIWAMTYSVVQKVLDEGIKPASVVSNTALGALDETITFLNKAYTQDIGSPRNFIASVHNSMAGKIALDFKIEGLNLTVCDGQNSFASAINSCSMLSDENFPILFISVDEKIDTIMDVSKGFTNECRKYITDNWKNSATAFILSNKKNKNSVEISSEGQYTLLEKDLDKFLQELPKEGRTILKIDDCSSYYTNSTNVVVNLLKDGQKGNYTIPTYSPTAQSVATVELCI